jgi:ligand-binding sensor domain-containing protein
MTTSRMVLQGAEWKGTVLKKITFRTRFRNLPSSDARAVAADNRNQLWIGTTKGLRIVPNTAFQTETR